MSIKSSTLAVLGSLGFFWLAQTALAQPMTPPNDRFTNCAPLFGPSGTVAGNNVGATPEPGGEPPNGPQPLYGRTVWWCWVAPEGGAYHFTTVGSSFDTILCAFTGSAVGSLTEEACDDDYFGSGGASRVTVYASAGTIHYFRVDGYNGQQGTITLQWSLAAPFVGSVQEVNPNLLQVIALDTDQDGILDEREMILGTDPQLADSDRDGFDDLFEDTFRPFGFDPLRPNMDSDQDGLSDDFEAVLGTNPFSPDSDGDAFSDFDEVLNGVLGFEPLFFTQDQDFDGLADDLEHRLGTLPDVVDTDGDGASDFEEFQAGLDPTRPQEGGFGELVGTTYSAEMAAALVAMRGGGSFPSNLVAQLPYPEVTTRAYSGQSFRAGVNVDRLRPSAALLQSSVSHANIGLSVLYSSYNGIVNQLKNIAEEFDGNPRPRIVRLFRWSQPTDGGRYIYAMKISDQPQINEAEKEILFMGVHHARELITGSMTLGLIRELTAKYAAGDAAIQSVVDNSEIWVIPVVNPDGYSMAVGERNNGSEVNWRKNTRKVAEPTPGGAMQTKLGVDPNRNYGFEHMRTFTAAQRAALPDRHKEVNGLNKAGQFDPDLESYGGHVGFSDVEAQAVRGLVESSFVAGLEVDGIKCSLSWHSYGGEVMYPMGHATANGLDEADRPHFKKLTDAYAAATGYINYQDTWPSIHYPTWGDSDDWLYKTHDIFAVTVEAYSSSEQNGAGPDFFPDTAPKRDAVVASNIAGAIAFINTCCAPSGLAIKAVHYDLERGLTLTFDTDPGAAYVVEFTSSLTSQVWRQLTLVQGNGATAVVHDDTASEEAMRFYRIRQQ